jgi:hypothetical protein
MQRPKRSADDEWLLTFCPLRAGGVATPGLLGGSGLGNEGGAMGNVGTPGRGRRVGSATTHGRSGGSAALSVAGEWLRFWVEQPVIADGAEAG